jgi:UDP-glucose 4-epimerase|tara:strand:- start:1359 stop:2345 length:987 start_codon:yes stop_codon:yes gene_type:complete
VLKKAIITGGCGFIGSHLVDLLIKKNFKLVVIDNLESGNLQNIKHHLKNKNLVLEKKNILEIDLKNKIYANTKYIFHLAGKGEIVPSIEKPYDYINQNVLGTAKILELSKKLKVKKFIYAASSSCYGLAKTPTKEDFTIDTKYPYALSKYQAEQLVIHWQKVYKIPFISIRIFNAYGTRSRTSGAYGAVIGTFLKQKIMKKPLTIVGNGKQRRDFIYVTDVANAFYKAAVSDKKNEIYNLGFGKSITVNYLAKKLSKELTYIPLRKGEPFETLADIKKIKKDLNWSPKIPFDEGIKIIINNIGYWKKAPLWNKKNIKKATKSWYKYMS